MAYSKEKNAEFKLLDNFASGSLIKTLLLSLFISGTGCSEKSKTTINSQTTIFSSSLKPKEELSTGSIKGQVFWSGPTPIVEGFTGPISPLSEHASKPRLPWPNPNAPKINPINKGIQHAVVFLDVPETNNLNKISFPPAQVETDNFKMQINQAGTFSPVGFVTVGDGVDFVNKQDFFYSIRARGDAFFSIPLSNKNKPVHRVFTKPGIATLTTGTGQFWMRSHLFVLTHPYAASCDKNGSFEIANLPQGRHDFKVWIPNWRVCEKEIDAETWEITRLEFAPPATKKFSASILPNSAPIDQKIDFALSDMQAQK
ncbi:MAG: hypothetical protein EBT92_13225 [Planctomycetes bacterium]|nr:hypothetical protein [Planctomycetota bacterium]